MKKEKKINRLLEALRNLDYATVINSHGMSEMSKKSFREYGRSAIRYGKMCRRICKREGWEIKKEESTNG